MVRPDAAAAADHRGAGREPARDVCGIPLGRDATWHQLVVPGAESSTTADIFGRRLYVVDAKFSTFGDPSTTYQVTAIGR